MESPAATVVDDADNDNADHNANDDEDHNAGYCRTPFNDRGYCWMPCDDIGGNPIFMFVVRCWDRYCWMLYDDGGYCPKPFHNDDDDDNAGYCWTPFDDDAG